MTNRIHQKSRKGTGAKGYTGFIPLHSFIIFAAIAIFIFNCTNLFFTQDDAYISFRYAANFLAGKGLVYNAGEHVEGYTNFLWVMILAFFKGVFGLDFIFISRLFGILSGSAIFILLALLLNHPSRTVSPILLSSIFIVLLSNLSLPYWAVSSLETGAFSCMALASVAAEYKYPRITPALLILATLLRPEGVIIFAAVFLYRCIVERKIPLAFILLYVVPLLPFMAFKILYYGSLFPNPFYAKSGVGLEYIKSGLEYTWFFAQSIGVYGIVFLVPLIAIKKLWNEYSLLYIVVILYTAYIVWVGGDVLPAYRFFVPLAPLLCFLFVMSLREIISLLHVVPKYASPVVLFTAAVFACFSYLQSADYISTCRDREAGLSVKMKFKSTMLKLYGGEQFSLATTTIGLIGYELLDHRVIDLLGLTDKYIARHPETIEGIKSSWKERRFNCRYLLEQQPTFIMFSTGYKPSAPAERALFLHSEFRRNYSTLPFVLGSSYYPVWRRNGTIDIAKDVVCPNVEFVDKINAGYNSLKRPEIALRNFQEAQQRLGEQFAVLSYAIGDCFLKLNQIDNAKFYLQQALLSDSLCSEAKYDLLEIADKTRNTKEYLIQQAALKKTAPWLLQ